MIVGMITEVAIFYVSEYVEVQPMMERRQALIAAGKNRMRPITMTTLAAIFALLPLAMALGAGSAMQQPLAIAIISGLLLKSASDPDSAPGFAGFFGWRGRRRRKEKP